MRLRPIALAATIALVTAGGATPAQAVSTVKLTAVDKVYEQAARSLLRIGGVYHLKTATATTVGTKTGHSTKEQWIDVAHGASRSLLRQTSSPYPFGPAASTSTQLLADNVRWYGGTPTSPSTCHRVTPAASDLLGCPFSDLKEDSTVVHGRWHGRKVVVLVVHTTELGDAATIRSTTMTYLDPATALPLASVTTGAYQTQKTLPLSSTTTYRQGRLGRASLPKNFFSPAALGWKAPDPLKGLPHGLPIYWPGRTWVPGHGLPAVTLQSVELPAVGPAPFSTAYLLYAQASDPYGPVVLTLADWTAADWTKAKVGEPVPLCKPVSHVTLPLGTVTLRCPGGVDGPFGDVDAPGAHLTVDAPSYEAAAHLTFSPFASTAALETVLNALTVRP